MKKTAVLMLILLLLLPTTAFALTAELSAAQTTVECGDSISVNVVYREDSVGAVRAAFSYDDTILEYVGGAGSVAANGSGTVVLLTESASAVSLQTTLEFRALCAGTAEIKLTTKEALSFEEQPLALPEASLAVKVRKAADSYVIVTAGERTMHALCTPPYIPMGYTAKEVTVAGKTLTAACAGDAEYLYLTDPEETTGGYYLRKDGQYLPAAELVQRTVFLPFSEIPDGRSVVRNGDIEMITDGTEYCVNTLLADGTEQICAIDPETMLLQADAVPVLTQTEPHTPSILPRTLAGLFGALLLAIVIAAICKRKKRAAE